MKLTHILFHSMFKTKIRLNCSVDFTYFVCHPFNHIGKLLSSHVIHAVGDILSAVLAQCFNGYFNCACGVFAHIPVSGCVYVTSFFAW